MQSSTTNHYLTGEFNENFLYNDQEPTEENYFPSERTFETSSHLDVENHQQINENNFRTNFNGSTNGLTGLEIKGKVRTLSPVLFYQTNTRFLIMSNNQLKNLPAEIGNLTNLVYLDLSNNRLKTLPSQIGDLTNLKQLYLESNLLKNLPYELGKLNLDDLGLSNNPLGDQILSLFARPNGTREVMNYLREKWTLICSYSKMSLTWNGEQSDSNL